MNNNKSNKIPGEWPMKKRRDSMGEHGEWGWHLWAREECYCCSMTAVSSFIDFISFMEFYWLYWASSALWSFIGFNGFFLYIRKVMITMHNAELLLIAADCLEVPTLKAGGERFLADHVRFFIPGKSFSVCILSIFLFNIPPILIACSAFLEFSNRRILFAFILFMWIVLIVY